MIELAPLEEAYQKVCYGYSEPDEMRMNGNTSRKIHTLDGAKYNMAKVVVDETLSDGEVVFVNHKIKDNPPTHLGKIEEKHWTSRVTVG